MPFWNPLISGKRVLDLEFSNSTTGVVGLDGSSLTLRSWADSVSPTGTTNGYDEINITIPSDYIIGGGTTAKCLEIGDFPNQDVKIINNGYIVGNGNSGNAVRVPNNIRSLEIENNGILSSGGTVGAGQTAGPLQIGYEGSAGKAAECFTQPGGISTGSPGPGAGYNNGGPISPPVSTPFASFPLGPVTFNVGQGSPGPVISPSNGCPGATYSGAGGTGTKLGNGGSYIFGSGTPLVTFSGSGNIYGPNTNPEGVNHPNGPQPAQP